jgi:tetratricopeptide (TPR) repeat protein
MRSHPRDSLLLEIIRRSGKSLDGLLEHVEGCPKCRQRIAELRKQEGVVRLRPRGEDYGPSFDRASEAVRQRQATLDLERSEAPALLGRLLGLTPERQRLLLNNSQRYQTWGLLELLIARGKEETFTDPEHAEEILQLALGIAGRLPSAFYGDDLVEDMRARSWGYVANTRRVRQDFAAAEEALGEAFLHLASGSEDPLEKAVLWNLEASLRRAQKLFDSSLEISRRAVSIFRRSETPHLLAKALVNRSTIYAHLLKPTQAASILHEALGLIDPTRKPRLALFALHNLVDNLADAGRFTSAQKMLRYARPLYRLSTLPIMSIGYQFLGAKVSYGLGQPESEQRLHAMIDVFYQIGWADMKTVLQEVAALKDKRTARIPRLLHL